METKKNKTTEEAQVENLRLMGDYMELQNNNNLKIVINPYNNPLSKNRLGLFINGFWNDSILNFIKDNEIKALYLNVAKGWKERNYSFLSKLGMIEELHIIASMETFELSAVETMSSLEELSITCSTKDSVDFTKLVNLKNCFISWWSGAVSIFSNNSLRDLYIDELKLKDYSILYKQKQLHSLTIGNSPIADINWIQNFQKLIKLRLLNCRKITDFQAIYSCENLKWLTISGNTNLSNLNFVSKLDKLEVLDFSDSGNIESLLPLQNLHNLKAVAFAGAKTQI